MRIGTKKKPFYRVVAVDERSKRTGGYIELLGTYNPLTEPKDIKLKQDRIDYWIQQGAQMSEGFLRIIGKAPQRPPRKPKRGKGESVKGEEKSQEAVQQPAKQHDEAATTEERAIQKNSENSDNQNVSESEKPKNQTEQVSELSDSPTPSDESGTPSPSESSESKPEEK